MIVSPEKVATPLDAEIVKQKFLALAADVEAATALSERARVCCLYLA